MSKTPRRPCVVGCDPLSYYGVPLHKFPNPVKYPDIFTAWMTALGAKVHGTDPVKIYNTKRICDLHFDAANKTTRGRLIRTAVPTNLNRMQQSLTTVVQIDHSYCVPTREPMPSNYEHRILVDVTNMPGPSGHNTGVPTREPMPSNYEHRILVDVTNMPGPSGHNKSSETVPSTVFPMPSGSDTTTCLTTSGKYQTRSSFRKFDADKTFQYLQTKTEAKALRKERQLKNEIRRLQQKVKNLKKRHNIEKNSSLREFERLTRNMPESTKLFTRMQLIEGQKKKKGRRFTLDEKILSLSLFKKSPKAYKLMCKHFTLPSKKVLKSLLAQIKISPGINNIVFKELETTVSKMLPSDRLCTLLFDEMSISPHMHYNVHTDDLIGFENDGVNKSEKIANHALVFMVKGVKKNFKQPVAYYFHQTLKTPKLKQIIQEVVSNCQATGLKVVATVCDQSTINVSAINGLISEAKSVYQKAGKEWRKDIIIINNEEIIPLYDVPHLIKGLRNNLLNKNMVYSYENEKKIVKWEYFQKVYEADKLHGELRILPKLTTEHVDPDKIKKMRVKNAVQILSHSMAVATDHLAARGDIPSECLDLIPFVLIIDKLFDSFNSSSFSVPNGKVYRACVKRNSPHHELWQEALKLLKSIKFIVEKNDGQKIEKSVPTINNLIKTIEGFKALWQLLSQKYSLDAMMTRNFNQDPLENFFGCIRSLGVRNVIPNCVGFEGAFKTLLLNNYSSHHSINSNCEEDYNNCLQSLKFFIKNKQKSSAPSESQHIVIDQPLSVLNTKNTPDSGADQRIYVCGWALTKCLQKVVKGCKKCKSRLLSNSEDNANKLIRAKEYTKNKQWLCYPSDCLVACFHQIQETTIAFLNEECYKKNIKERIRSFIEIFDNFDFHDCEKHKVEFKKHFIDTSINIIIYSWCRSVNRILDGKLSYDGHDKVKNAAQAYYNKHKTNKTPK